MNVYEIRNEVESGLPAQQADLLDALANQHFYNGEGDNYLSAREGEEPYDFQKRRKRCTNLVAEVINPLCSHLYNPGPTRKCESSDAADAWLQQAYDALDINAYWQQADILSTLNDYCAFQVIAWDDPAKPVRLQLWGREECVVYADPDDPTVPAVVVTIDRYNGRTRYRAWDAERVLTFETREWKQERPSNQSDAWGRGTLTSRLVSDEEHGYGELPFVLVHYTTPVRSLDTPSPGTAIRKANESINAQLSDMSEAIEKYARPWLLGYNLPDTFRPTMRAGAVLRLVGDRGLAEVGMQPPEPRIDILQVPVDTANLWDDINHYIDLTLENYGIPKSAVRMTEQTAASGAAIFAEQMPLLTRARQRRPMFAKYEEQLAGLVLRIGGRAWQQPEIEAAGQDPQLSLTWGEYKADVPGVEQDQSDQAQLDMGITSRVEIIARRNGMTRDQAIAHLEQISEDEKLYQSLNPAPMVDPAMGVPTSGQEVPAAPADAEEEDPEETDAESQG